MHLVAKDGSLFGISLCFGIFGISVLEYLEYFGSLFWNIWNNWDLCLRIFLFETQSPVLLRDVDSDHGDRILAEKRPSSDVRELEGVVHLKRDHDDDDSNDDDVDDGDDDNDNAD